MHQNGNNYEAIKTKTVRQPFRYFIGDPTTQFFLPDDRELNGKQIVGITAITQAIYNGDVRLSEGSFEGSVSVSNGTYVTLTFFNLEGEEIISNHPHNALANLDNRAAGTTAGKVIPINAKINLRMSYFKVTDPATVIKPCQLVLLFYYRD
jgi:hypothetical protein